MSIIDLQTFKGFMREMTDDLDAQFQLALNAAEAEVGAFIGESLGVRYPAPSELPADVLMAVMYLARVHAEDGDAEHYRGVGQRLLKPYRMEAGVRAA